jgi:hypothetical protein
MSCHAIVTEIEKMILFGGLDLDLYCFSSYFKPDYNSLSGWLEIWGDWGSVL